MFVWTIQTEWRTMATDNTTDIHACTIDKTGTFQIFITSCTLPFHVFIIKILAKDTKFDIQRHRILFSLSLSDAAITSALFILGLVNKATNLTTESSGCVIYRGFTIFIACSTLVVSSVLIAAMSMERYIACIHSFHLHRILTESRVRYGTISTWLMGAIIGMLAAFTNHYDGALVIPNNSAIQYIYIAFVIPTSAVVIFVQFRLFLFSRTKINQINPKVAFGARLELLDFRRKQFKIAFMASIVAAAFVVCMIPLAVVFLYELLSGVSVSPSFRAVVLSFSFSNCFADPFIYGVGIGDTRKLIIRDLKKVIPCLLDLLPANACPISQKKEAQTSC